jgi:hypothetical protein
VLRRVATLQELETHWSYLDLLRAHDACDIEDELQALADKAAAEKAKGR